MGGSDDVGSLSETAFVARVEQRLDSEGWTTSAHEVSFGAVIEATRDGRTRLAVVVPDGSATIPPELIDRLVPLRKRVGAESVSLTTRGTYTDAALERADDAAVELVDPAAAVATGDESGLAATAAGALGGIDLPDVGSSLAGLRGQESADEETPADAGEEGDAVERDAGGDDAGGARDSRVPVSRRGALVAGGGLLAAASAGVVVTRTGVLGGLLGDGGPPVHPEAERVELGSDAAERVRSSEDLRFPRPDDAAVSVYTLGTDTGPDAVARWYRTHATVGGWERTLTTADAFVYRRGDRGLVVLVQRRNAFVDTGLPVEGDPPTDVLLVGMEWGYLAPVADGLPVYPDADYTELSAAAAERVRTTDVLDFDRPDDTTVMVYAVADAGVATVRSWYASDARAATGGWERRAATERGAVYRKGDRGLVVLVQERNALVDTGLPVEGDAPTDVLALEMGWGTLEPLVG